MGRQQRTVETQVLSKRRSGAGFSIPAAAEELGVSYKTLRDAIALGQVRVIEFGKLRRVSKAEI